MSKYILNVKVLINIYNLCKMSENYENSSAFPKTTLSVLSKSKIFKIDEMVFIK